MRHAKPLARFGVRMPVRTSLELTELHNDQAHSQFSSQYQDHTEVS